MTARKAWGPTSAIRKLPGLPIAGAVLLQTCRTGLWVDRPHMDVQASVHQSTRYDSITLFSLSIYPAYSDLPS